ncbi:hypothetical protein [Zavarzinia sp.]|uniref:hypothetical protein n=1 Tax=Zavarzinia sp. TaxID=2027920 RepID=UPI0035688F8A
MKINLLRPIQITTSQAIGLSTTLDCAAARLRDLGVENTARHCERRADELRKIYLWVEPRMHPSTRLGAGANERELRDHLIPAMAAETLRSLRALREQSESDVAIANIDAVIAHIEARWTVNAPAPVISTAPASRGQTEKPLSELKSDSSARTTSVGMTETEANHVG